MPPKGSTTNAVTPGTTKYVSDDPNFQYYPKMLYYLGDASKQKIVNSEAEENDAGPYWYDKPLEVPDPEPAPAPAEV